MSFSCSALFLVMANGGHLGMPNHIKSKWLHTRNILAQSWINFNQWFSRYCHFCVNAIFSNRPWGPSWIVNLHKFEIVPLKKSKQLHTRNILAQSWINFNQYFLRYCHFHVYAIFSNGPWCPSLIVNLHKYEMVPFRDHCDQIWSNYIHVFLRYWHLSKIGLVSAIPVKSIWGGGGGGWKALSYLDSLRLKRKKNAYTLQSFFIFFSNSLQLKKI